MTPIPSPALDPGIPPAVNDAIEAAMVNFGIVCVLAAKAANTRGVTLVSEVQDVKDEKAKLRSSISDALREATRAERERCAKVICMACHYGMLHENGECTAAAIRRSPTSDATNGR